MKLEPEPKHADEQVMISSQNAQMNEPASPLVQLSGYFQMDLGLGHSVRLMAKVLEKSRIPFGYKNYNNAGPHRAMRPWKENDSEADNAPIHICGVNMDNLSAFWKDHPEMFSNDRYLVGIWFWEVPIIPEEYLKCIEAIDEIWVPTEYMRDIFRKHCDKPVFCYPQPILADKIEKPTSSERAIFRFYFSFDFCSLLRRKNPDGLIRAFLRAFPAPGTAELLVKSVNGHLYPSEMTALRKMIHHASHVHWIDGHLPQDDLQRLQENVDGYASLHRSEGYGLTIAESMASGKPVLATAHSGNMTFMNESNSYPVPFELVPVGPGAEPYPSDALWAEPDEEAAARLMIEMVSDRNLREAKVAIATRDIETRFSIEAGSDWVRNRVIRILEAMKQENPGSEVTWPRKIERPIHPPLPTRKSKKRRRSKKWFRNIRSFFNGCDA